MKTHLQFVLGEGLEAVKNAYLCVKATIPPKHKETNSLCKKTLSAAFRTGPTPQ